MNGSNSNTSGADVATIGYWPKSILPAILTGLDSLRSTVKRVLAGEIEALQVDFAGKAPSDSIPDKQMREIARRLVVTREDVSTGNIVLSPNPPDDKTKLWGQTDASSGVVIGQLMRYDSTQGKWVSTVDGIETYTPPKEQRATAQIPEGNQTVNLAFTDMGRTDYFLAITLKTFLNGAWALPVTPGGTFAAFVTNQTETSVTVTCYNVPTGGLLVEAWVRNPES